MPAPTIDFPNERIQVEGTTNPLFITDISNANLSTLEGLKALTGLGNSDFAIISGLVYDGISSYSAGIAYINGQFYFCKDGINEGEWLEVNDTDVNASNQYGDTAPRFTYTVHYCQGVGVDPSNGTPQFSGDMNEYIFNISKNKEDIDTLNTPIAWQNLSLGVGWSVNETVAYKKDTVGNIVLKGNIEYVSGGNIATLPVGFRPAQEIKICCPFRDVSDVSDSGWTKTPAFIQIETNGVITLINSTHLSIAVGDQINFGNIYYRND